MEIKSGLRAEKNDESDEGGDHRSQGPLDDRMRISTITALARAIHEQSLGHRSFRPRNIGGSSKSEAILSSLKAAIMYVIPVPLNLCQSQSLVCLN